MASWSVPSPVSAENRHQLGEAIAGRPRLQHGQQRRLGHLIDLVERQHDGPAHLGQDLLERLPRTVGHDVGRALAGVGCVDQHQGHVALARGGQGHIAHVAAEGAFTPLGPRGVEEDDLRRGAAGGQVVDRQHPVAGGLRPGRDRAQAHAQEPVDQGRLAGVGKAEDGAGAGDGGPGGGAGRGGLPGGRVTWGITGLVRLMALLTHPGEISLHPARRKPQGARARNWPSGRSGANVGRCPGCSPFGDPG